MAEVDPAAILALLNDVERPVETVKLSGLAALKAIQHCKGVRPSPCSGQLLGVDLGPTLEVTDAFAFPAAGSLSSEVSKAKARAATKRAKERAAAAAAGVPVAAGEADAEDDEDDEEDALDFQTNMMRCMRENHADAVAVGWYQSAGEGPWQTPELLRALCELAVVSGAGGAGGGEGGIRADEPGSRSRGGRGGRGRPGDAEDDRKPATGMHRSICLVYDPEAAAAGGSVLPLRAVTVKDEYARAWAGGRLTFERCLADGLGWRDALKELPLDIFNDPLTTAHLESLRVASHAAWARPAPEATVPLQTPGRPVLGPAPLPALRTGPPSALEASPGPALERALVALTGLCDDWTSEQQRVTKHHKTLAWQLSQLEQARARRRQENVERRARGEEPLPEDDPNAARAPEPPGMEGAHLIMAQIAGHAELADTVARKALARLHVAAEL
jgi:translation initiation factor 3 subunit H